MRTCGIKKRICIVPGCRKLATKNRKICGRHIAKKRRYGNIHAFTIRTNDYPFCPLRLKGDYWVTKINRKWNYVHRVVMGHYLGRPLKSSEIVHHGPMGKRYNNITNLSLTTRSEHIILDRSKIHKKAMDAGIEPF